MVVQPTSEQIHHELARMTGLAEAFEKNHAQQTVCVFAIVWVGIKIDCTYNLAIIDDKIKSFPGPAADGTIVIEHFHLTSAG